MMLKALRTIFLVAIIVIMSYWLLTVAEDVRRAGALAMSDLRDGGIVAMLIYLAAGELGRKERDK